MNVLISITYLLSCPEQYGLSSTAINILYVFSSTILGKNNDDEGLTLLDVHFRTILPKVIAAHEFPWKQSDPAFLAMDALLRHCKGSTVGNNFGLVAPFFISHLSNIPKKNEDDIKKRTLLIIWNIKPVSGNAPFSIFNCRNRFTSGSM